jgi:hypothetical protein
LDYWEDQREIRRERRIQRVARSRWMDLELKVESIE